MKGGALQRQRRRSSRSLRQPSCTTHRLSSSRARSGSSSPNVRIAAKGAKCQHGRPTASRLDNPRAAFPQDSSACLRAEGTATWTAPSPSARGVSRPSARWRRSAGSTLSFRTPLRRSLRAQRRCARPAPRPARAACGQTFRSRRDALDRGAPRPASLGIHASPPVADGDSDGSIAPTDARRARAKQLQSDAGLARIAVRTRFFDDALMAREMAAPTPFTHATASLRRDSRRAGGRVPCRRPRLRPARARKWCCWALDSTRAPGGERQRDPLPACRALRPLPEQAATARPRLAPPPQVRAAPRVEEGVRRVRGGQGRRAGALRPVLSHLSCGSQQRKRQTLNAPRPAAPGRPARCPRRPPRPRRSGRRLGSSAPGAATLLRRRCSWRTDTRPCPRTS